MSQFELYIWLFSIIALIGIISKKIPIPMPLIIMMSGMLLSFIPDIPAIRLNPSIVFTIFLPLLVYESSVYISWRDIKKNKRPIALLSIGHVIFIATLVAIVAHYLIPELSWPMAFMLGAIISPPDDVAIFAISEKIYIPQRLMIILAGESLLNDATALIMFRFSLAAIITKQFYPFTAMSEFIVIIVCETLYGVALGNLLGQMRLRINEPKLEILLSLLTPFFAYLPAVYFGGCGVLATVVTGLVIGHIYLERFSPSARLLWRSVWQTMGFIITSILFLLVGLNFNTTLKNISAIPTSQLFLYGFTITATVIIGRFIWVYPAAYIPRFVMQSIRKKDPYPPWQFPLILSWSGMRGGVSLAAALSIPDLSVHIGTIDLRDLIIFLVFCVIIATLLIQGLSLPWLMKWIGTDKIGQSEKKHDLISELVAKSSMADATLHWLNKFKTTQKHDPDTLTEIEIQISEYNALKNRLDNKVAYYESHELKLSPASKNTLSMSAQIIEVERQALSTLWHAGKITLNTRNKLLEQLDLRSKRFMT